MSDFAGGIKATLLKIRQQHPVIHQITNFVTINDCANITTALGASPVMACCSEEAEDITSASQALVLNLGTPDNCRFEAAALSGKKANTHDIPIIIDPVGIGASAYRKAGVENILKEVHPSVIKGNAAEIRTLAGISNTTNKCIDSAETIESLDTIKSLARELHTVIAVSGREDIITDGIRTARISRGTEMFTFISGAGCMTSSVIGAFLSVESDPFAAAVNAVYCVNICGEKAAAQSKGPADFRINFINVLYSLADNNIEEEGIFFG